MNKVHATIMGLVLVAVVCVAIMYYLRTNQNNQNKAEHFENSLHEAGGLKPCNALITEDMPLESKGMADMFVKTNRVKAWQPKNSIDSNLDPNMAYCYMNYDLDKNLADYAVNGNGTSAEACSKANNMFASADFVVDVFQNNNHEVTYNEPFNKCIMKIDTTKRTPENMKQFWDNMGNDVCAAKTKSFYDLLRKLRQQYASCTQLKNLYTQSNTVELPKEIAYLNETLSNVGADYLACEAERNRLIVATADMRVARDKLAADTITYDETCKRLDQQRQNEYSKCIVDKQTLEEAYKSLYKDKTQRAIDLEDMMNNYAITQSNYNNLATEMMKEGQLVYSLTTEYNTLFARFSVCDVQRTDCNSNLASCSAELQKVTDERNAASNSYWVCYPQLVDCRARLADCLQTCQQLDSNIANLKIQYDVCSSNLTNCRSNSAVYEASNVAMSNEIVELLKLVPQVCTVSSNDIDKVNYHLKKMTDQYSTYSNDFYNKSLSNYDGARVGYFGDNSNNFKVCQESIKRPDGRVRIHSHWVTLAKAQTEGTSDWSICNKDEAKNRCPKMCEKMLPGMNATWTGEFLPLTKSRGLCACAYKGEEGDRLLADSIGKKIMRLRKKKPSCDPPPPAQFRVKVCPNEDLKGNCPEFAVNANEKSKIVVDSSWMDPNDPFKNLDKTIIGANSAQALENCGSISTLHSDDSGKNKNFDIGPGKPMNTWNGGGGYQRLLKITFGRECKA